MKKDCNYYLFNILLSGNKLDIPKIKVKFNEIVFQNQTGEVLKKVSKDVFLESTNRNFEYLLFIENDNFESFDFLFDEEFDIVDFNVEFYIDNEKLILKKFIPNSNFSYKEIQSDFLETFRVGTYFEKTVALKGVKPNEMFGYNIETAPYKKIAFEIALEIEKQIKISGITHVLTGSDLGFDTVSFFAIEYLKNNGYPNLKNILVVPFMNINKKWSINDKKRFKRMNELADYVIYVDEIFEYNIDLSPIGEYHELKLNKSVYFIIDNSNKLITYWNNISSPFNCLNYAIKKEKDYINLYK